MSMTSVGEGWSLKSVGDVARVGRGASPRPIASDRWFDPGSEVRWVRIADLNRSNGRLLKETTQALSSDGIARSRRLEPGTLILSIAATVGLPIVTDVPACIHDGFVALTDLSVDQRFLFYALKFSQDRLREAGQSGSQTNVNTEIVNGFKILIPDSLVEQRIIADALWEVDDGIELLTNLIAKKRDIKQGVMQQLLTGRTRLPGFASEWLETTWGEVTSVTRSGSTPRRSNPKYWGGHIPWVTSTELKRSVVDHIPQTITEAGLKNANLTIWPKGTFLMAITGLEAAGTRGSCGFLGIEAATNQSCMAIIPNHRLDSEFLFYFYLLRGEELAFQYTQGTKQMSYNAAVVKSLPISMPRDINEQKAIAQVLRSIQSELALLEQKLAKMKDIKQGMMQQLLTGRVRLPETEEVKS